MNNDYRYPWPASALTPEEMALLHTAREESGKPRILITRLIAETLVQKIVEWLYNRR